MVCGWNWVGAGRVVWRTLILRVSGLERDRVRWKVVRRGFGMLVLWSWVDVLARGYGVEEWSRGLLTWMWLWSLQCTLWLCRVCERGGGRVYLLGDSGTTLFLGVRKLCFFFVFEFSVRCFYFTFELIVYTSYFFSFFFRRYLFSTSYWFFLFFSPLDSLVCLFAYSQKILLWPFYIVWKFKTLSCWLACCVGWSWSMHWFVEFDDLKSICFLQVKLICTLHVGYLIVPNCWDILIWGNSRACQFCILNS